MLHIESSDIRNCLLHGKFGLEKEGLRVYENAAMAHTPHPFADDNHITRDFSENQTEINTCAEPSAEGAVLALQAYDRQIRRKIASLERPEYIWPFSNPPFLSGEDDVPIAQFRGDLASKTLYREYLSDRYGRYKMTFSGIHVNYSFSEELLRKEFSRRGPGRSRSFRDSFYLELAEKASAYGWLLVILTAASPVLDASYFEKTDGRVFRDVFSGDVNLEFQVVALNNFYVVGV
jgi:gamma-glutamylcysteine synthetase